MSAPTNWTQLPLAGDGRSLVEASAGTGKTWTIAVLYLRLLLEEQRTPRQIIVSTFTNAAAAELRERLRAKMVWALFAAESGATCASDASLDHLWLHARWKDNDDQRRKDAQCLKAALGEFDAAPVSTLHSLCSRILADHPFAAGALFQGRSLVDAKELFSGLEDDLWRVISQSDDDNELARLAAEAGVVRKDLKKYLPALLQPNVQVDAFDEQAFLAQFDFLGDFDTWQTEVRELLSDSNVIKQGCPLHRRWGELIEYLLDPVTAKLNGTARNVLHAAEELRGVTDAGKADPRISRLVTQTMRILQVLDNLPDLQSDLLTHPELRRFLVAAQIWCKETLGVRLEAGNQSTFDQLVLMVHQALQPVDGHRALADALFDAWPVALVDEFQDTDPVQFGILDAIYRTGDGGVRGRLVMIGDPKQAIYRFRGGDVQAYERAAADAGESDRLMLDTNFRSSRAVIAAVNDFYAIAGETMGPENSDTTIAYEEVKASSRQDGSPLTIGKRQDVVERPVVLHMLDAETDGKLWERAALEACAGQIAQALSDDGYRIAGAPIQPGDIAVLLPSHGQIRTLAGMLKTRGVPCVTQSNRSVFASSSADELQLVLHAAMHPEDPRAIRAAVATRIWGGSLADLYELRDDAARWDAVAWRFRELHGELIERGPQAVVDAVLAEQAARLLTTREGERILTDLRHLGELLQQAWMDYGDGERLGTWFAQQISDESADNADADARAQRLESDAGRVRLMTLHASKGLEFPVVYLPLMWKHGESKASQNGARLLPNDSDGRKHLVLDTKGAAVDAVKLQETEERYRILYVALTRAIHACHVFLLPQTEDVKKSRSVPNHVPLNRMTGALIDALQVPDHGFSIELIGHCESFPGVLYERPEHNADASVARPMPPAWRGPLPMRHSFSTLQRGYGFQSTLEEAAADDEALAEGLDESSDDVPATAVTPHPALDTLAPIAGADFGNAVHGIFEHRVSGVPLHEQTTLVRQQLQHFGVRPHDGELEDLVVPLTGRLQQVLEARLGGADGPRLADLGHRTRREEMEFNYVLGDVSLRRLRAICEQHGEHDLVPAYEQSLSGLMNGKIDLVFEHGGAVHVLDYKSNRLGDSARQSLEDYAPAALEVAMQAAGYRFQALLYVIAVERYLKERLGGAYERARHLGDCWYLFVRATGLSLPDGQPCGVWRHRFSDALLDAVQAELVDHAERGAA